MTGPDESTTSMTPDEERASWRGRTIEENVRASSPIVTELKAAGFPVEGISDLYNMRMEYKDAIPILLRWLPSIDNDAVKEDIVRALSVKWAKPRAARPMIEEYGRAHDPTGIGLKWAIGNALAVVADDSVFDEIVELARDKRHGRAREMLVLALGNMRNPHAVDVLIELLGDEVVGNLAILALGRLKAGRARQHIEAFLTHPKQWVRQEARRALAKIDKAEERRRGAQS